MCAARIYSPSSIIYNKISGSAFLRTDMDLKEHVCQSDEGITTVLWLNKA